MALTYIELYNAALGDNLTRARVTIAISKYARFLVGGGGTPSAGRLAWAKAAIADTKGATDQIIWGVVGDAAYITAGSAITDAALQAALEAAVNAVNP